MNQVNILGVHVDRVTIHQAAQKIMDFFKEDRLHMVFTPNSEIIMVAYQDPEFAALLNSADLLTADGIGVVYAAKLLKRPIAERAAGYDIAREVLSQIAKQGQSLFLFGGKPGVAEEAKQKLEQEYPGLKIVGTHNGYFSREEEGPIVEQINASGAELVFVCLGAPAQEKWLDRHRDELQAKVAMGIGGSLDVFAGKVERAPEAWCKLGLEWLYRLIKEPWRLGRMMALPKFAITVLVKGHKFEQENK